MNAIPRVAPLRRLMREASMTNEPKAAETTHEAVCPEPVDVPATPSPIVDGNRRVYQSTDLLGADSEVLIAHRGQTYRLRCTKQGKLILYK
jgi:hemin uptake protein HemP